MVGILIVGGLEVGKTQVSGRGGGDHSRGVRRSTKIAWVVGPRERKEVLGVRLPGRPEGRRCDVRRKDEGRVVSSVSLVSGGMF